MPHLSYIGDADVGEQTNLGAGTITANYDGHAKHRTTIGSRVHGGVDTSFVAPVKVGDDAWTAAGSVVTDDVPPTARSRSRGRASATSSDMRRASVTATRSRSRRPATAACASEVATKLRTLR